ncbi:possible (AF261103) unknown [Myxococcus xanthus] [Prochlorococcus marinus str. MIT 9313]|uniref:Uncharacterized protein n=1 Tax=Prochlorococcus marinus (strain MIT 9313) TaxID=74547 RepID=Q7V5M3_PROMM|nr:possible (AF261103) unknown [Myxococcus xanthus] [Prochlorococcus marinus str. MIT 9313]
MSLDNGAFGQTVRVGLQILNFGDQQNHLEKFVDVLALDGTYGNHHHITSPLFGEQVLIRKFLLDPFWRGSLLVRFVDRHNDRNLGSACVADGLEGLRAYTIVSSNH